MLGSEKNNTNFDLKEQIRQEALRLGFSFCGFARCEPLEELRPFYSNFIKRESRTELGYLESNLEKRLHPELLLQGAKSVIALMMNYFPNMLVKLKIIILLCQVRLGLILLGLEMMLKVLIMQFLG